MNLAGLTDLQLEELHQQFNEVIQSVLSRLENDSQLQFSVQRLVQAVDMLQEFTDL